MIEKVKEAISSTTITVGAPLTGSGIGFIAMCEKIAPVLTVLSLLIGIVLGFLSYRLKKKLYNKKIQGDI